MAAKILTLTLALAFGWAIFRSGISSTASDRSPSEKRQPAERQVKILSETPEFASSNTQWAEPKCRLCLNGLRA